MQIMDCPPGGCFGSDRFGSVQHEKTWRGPPPDFPALASYYEWARVARCQDVHLLKSLAPGEALDNALQALEIIKDLEVRHIDVE